MTKTNINIGPAIENYGGQTFLSQEVTISLLQEAKNAFKRCHVVSLDFNFSSEIYIHRFTPDYNF